VYLLLLVTAAAVLLSVLYLMLTRAFTRLIMHFTLILSIMLNMYVPLNIHNSITYTQHPPRGICVYYWITQYYCSLFTTCQTRALTHVYGTAGAIIFTIIALFSVLSYWGFRSRIPLASLLLQVVMDVSKHHMSVYAVAFSALLIQAALAVYVPPLSPSELWLSTANRWFTFTAIAM
jgi:hypothetical protein